MIDKPQFSLKALKHRPALYELVQQEIKQYILHHKLQPGDHLPPETEFARQLGVSRNSVREAVKSLETLGVVEARSGAGLFVSEFSFGPLLEHLAYGAMFTAQDLADIMEVRFAVEYGMAEQAIESVTDEQIENLHTILVDMKQAGLAGDYAADDDRLFHEVLWENAGNKLISKINGLFWNVFQQAGENAGLPQPPTPLKTYDRHLKIVQALEQRNVEAFRDSIVYHRKGIEARIQVLKEQKKS